MPLCDWVLLDARDAIVHIFRPDVRQFYNLEKMWSADRPGEAEKLRRKRRSDAHRAGLRRPAEGRTGARAVRTLFQAVERGRAPRGRRRRRSARDRRIARARGRRTARAEEAAAIRAAVPAGACWSRSTSAAGRRPAKNGRPTSAGRAMRRARLCGRDRRPDGLGRRCARRRARVISFGAMTWPHQLVRVMAASSSTGRYRFFPAIPTIAHDRRDIGQISWLCSPHVE